MHTLHRLPRHFLTHSSIIPLHTDLDPDTILLNGIGDTLSKLDRFLSSTLGRKYKKTKTTTFSLQFRYDDYIDVDLLPSPYWGETPEYYHYYLQGKPVKDQMK